MGSPSPCEFGRVYFATFENSERVWLAGKLFASEFLGRGSPFLHLINRSDLWGINRFLNRCYQAKDTHVLGRLLLERRDHFNRW